MHTRSRYVTAASSTVMPRTLWRTLVDIAGIPSVAASGAVEENMVLKEPIVVVVGETEFGKAEATFRSAADVHCVVAPGAEDTLAAAVQRTGARFAIVGPLVYRGA